MHVIIVDNESNHINDLVRLCGPERSQVVNSRRLDGLSAPSDAIFVLSGRHGHHAASQRHQIVGSDDFYRTELNLIEQAAHPVIGVCFGFELIAHAAGAELVQRDRLETGEVKIYPTPEGTNWFPEHSIPVREAHRWVVLEPPPGYVSLAASTDGIEAIASLSKRIIGFQFHPELAPPGSAGARVFRHVLEQIAITP